MQETKTNNKTNKSRGKDYIAAGTVGFVTAFFANIIFISADIPLVFQGVTFPYWTFYIFFPLVESAGYFVAARIFARILILKQAGRFGIVGLMNFTVDTGILSILSRVTGVYEGLYIIPLNAVSVIVALTNSYFWNHYFTFKGQDMPSKKEFTAFLIVSAGGIAINSFIVYLFTTYIDPFNSITKERLEILAKIGATLVSLFWNFLGYKYIVFKSAPRAVEQTISSQ